MFSFFLKKYAAQFKIVKITWQYALIISLKVKVTEARNYHKMSDFRTYLCLFFEYLMWFGLYI